MEKKEAPPSEEEEFISLDCLAAFHDSIHEYPTVGDSILAFQDEFGYKFCEHCGVGIDTILQCKACKTVSYCSQECQLADWKEGGHKAECAAIKGEHTWAQYASELTNGAPLASSVAMRHYLRFAAAAAAMEPEDNAKEASLPDIQNIAARGGGGFRGGGGGGFRGGFRGGGFGGFRGGGGMLGGFRRGPSAFRGAGAFARPLGGRAFRWGGRSFGGYRYGFWPGWRFPWVYRYGLWFPWWFYINPIYYTTRVAYVDPYTGINYGVPPAAPGTWGNEVAPPPSGQGYVQPPVASPALVYADIGAEIVSLADLVKAWSDKVVELLEPRDQAVPVGDNVPSLTDGGNALKKGVAWLQARVTGKDKFERLMIAHTRHMLHLGMAKTDSAREAALSALKKNAYEWARHLDGVYGSVTKLLRNNSRDQRTASDILIDMLEQHVGHFVSMVDATSPQAKAIAKSGFISGAAEWANFWTVLTIDPAEIPIYLTSESTFKDLMRVFKAVAPANREVFLNDMHTHIACLLVHSEGHTAERHKACLESAAKLGHNIDERYNRAVGIREEVVAEPVGDSIPSIPGQEGAALIEANKYRKEEGKNLRGEKNSGRGDILYKKLTPKQRTTWAKWDRAKQGREIAEKEMRDFMSMGGGKVDPDQRRRIQNRIETLRGLERRYKEQVDAIIGSGRTVVTMAIEGHVVHEDEDVDYDHVNEEIGADSQQEQQEELIGAEQIGALFTRGRRRLTDEQVQARRDLETAQNELFEAERELEENKGSPIPKNERMLKNHVAAAKKRVEAALAKAKAANKRAKAAIKAASAGKTRTVDAEVPDPIEGIMDHFRRDPKEAARAAAQRDIDFEYQQLQRAKWELQRDPYSERMQQAVAYMEQQLAEAQRRMAAIGDAIVVIGGEVSLDMRTLQKEQQEEQSIAAEAIEPIGARHWIQGAIKHPGSFRRAANRADHGKYKGRTMAFAHHVLSSGDHPGLRRKAQLALTLSKLSHH